MIAVEGQPSGCRIRAMPGQCLVRAIITRRYQEDCDSRRTVYLQRTVDRVRSCPREELRLAEETTVKLAYVMVKRKGRNETISGGDAS